jgi:hypothetical protein
MAAGLGDSTSHSTKNGDVSDDETVIDMTAREFKYAKRHERGKKVEPFATRKLIRTTQPPIPVTKRKYGLSIPFPGGFDELSKLEPDDEVSMRSRYKT